MPYCVQRTVWFCSYSFAFLSIFVLNVSFFIVTLTFLARAWFLSGPWFLINAIKIRTLSATFTNHTYFSTYMMLFWFTLFRNTLFKTNFFLVVLKNSTDLLQWWLKTFQKKNFQNKAWEIRLAINQISERKKLLELLFWKNSFILLLSVIWLSEERRSSDRILVMQIFKIN